MYWSSSSKLLSFWRQTDKQTNKQTDKLKDITAACTSCGGGLMIDPTGKTRVDTCLSRFRDTSSQKCSLCYVRCNFFLNILFFFSCVTFFYMNWQIKACVVFLCLVFVCIDINNLQLILRFTIWVQFDTLALVVCHIVMYCSANFCWFVAVTRAAAQQQKNTSYNLKHYLT